jgi:GDSL-like Lipase/Acylhydrolase family/N-terminus of Esterase_SGNH_hydro-type
MTETCRIALVLSVVLALHPNRASAEDVRWRDAASFEIEGRGWVKTAGPYDRLPDSARNKVSKTAWDLSKETAGVCIRFVTDAAVVSVRWSVTSGSLAMPHMAATGVSGVDLYARSADDSWRFVGNGRPHKQDGNLGKFELPEGGRAGRECLLYLPVYNGTKSLEIGVPPEAHLDLPKPRPEGMRKPIVVYGTSIVQGGCASRPGMVWTAILGRMLDRPVINLGFSSAGTMEPPIAEPLAEIDAAAYVIDCIWNMSEDPNVYRDHVSKLVHTIRKARPDAPIIFVGQSLMRPEAHPTRSTIGQEAAVRALQDAGIKGLVAVPGTNLIGDDGEGTVDGVHLTDLGMVRQARALLPVVKEAVNGPSKPHVYIDTEMAAEIDDSYAIYRALVAPELHVVGLSSIGWEGPLDFPTNTRASRKMNEEVYRGDEKTGLSIAGTARSTDRGVTWETPVAIKAPAGVGLNAETDIIRLADGQLFAATRSFTDDMYYAITDDEARSWSEAKKAGFPAHSPRLTRLSDGKIILSHRLPKTSIHVSGNDAKTWQGPFLINDPRYS